MATGSADKPVAMRLATQLTSYPNFGGRNFLHAYLASTIVDLTSSEDMQTAHLTEALQYQPRMKVGYALEFNYNQLYGNDTKEYRQ